MSKTPKDNGYQNEMANLPTTNNNPGDLRNIGQKDASQGAGGFASFPTPQAGFGALLNDVQSKINTHPDWTLADFSNAYAPPTDGNDSATYAANLANQLKVAPNTSIKSLQGNIGQFAEAISHNEGYEGATSVSAQIPQSSPSASTALGVGGAIVGGGVLATLLTGGEDLLGPALSAGEGALGDAASWVAGLLGSKSGGSGGSTGGSSSSESSGSSGQSLQDLESSLAPATKASQALAQAQNQALGTTQGGRVMQQDPNFQNAMKTNAKYGFAPEVDEQGAMNFQGAMQKSQDAVEDLSKSAQNMLFAGGEVAPVQQAKQEAYQNIEKYVPVPDQEAAKKHVDEFADAYSAKLGDGQGNMSLGHFQQMKQEMGKAFDKTDTNAKTAAKKALSHGARRTIEQNTKHKELYNRVMKEEQNLINGRKVMKRLNGEKAPNNHNIRKLFNSSAAKFLEVYIGDKLGGPLGAVLGGLVGDYLGNQADKKFGKTIFETPAVHAALKELQEKKPAVYEYLKQELNKNGVITPKDFSIESKEGDKAGYTLQEMLKKNSRKTNGKEMNDAVIQKLGMKSQQNPSTEQSKSKKSK